MVILEVGRVNAVTIGDVARFIKLKKYILREYVQIKNFSDCINRLLQLSYLSGF